MKKYKFKSYNAESVKLTSVYDVLTSHEIELLKANIEMGAITFHGCTKNALIVSIITGADYCEGYINSIIFHCFNCKNGKYFDVNELLISTEVIDKTYIICRVFESEVKLKLSNDLKNTFHTIEGIMIGKYNYWLNDNCELVKAKTFDDIYVSHVQEVNKLKFETILNKTANSI